MQKVGVLQTKEKDPDPGSPKSSVSTPGSKDMKVQDHFHKKCGWEGKESGKLWEE